MKIATQNRLAHYQVEYDECCQRGAILQQQRNTKLMEVNQWASYLSINNGDASARKNWRRAQQELRSIDSEMRKLQVRLATLQRQINTEKMKIQSGR